MVFDWHAYPERLGGFVFSSAFYQVHPLGLVGMFQQVHFEAFGSRGGRCL